MAKLVRKLRGAKRQTLNLLLSLSVSLLKGKRGRRTKNRLKSHRLPSAEAMAKARRTSRRSRRAKPGPLSGVRRQSGWRQTNRVAFTGAQVPLPAFFLFMAQHRSALQAANPRWTAVDTVKRLGEMWHEQPEDVKQMYKDRAAWMRSKRRRGARRR